MAVDAELSGVEHSELVNLAEQAVRALTITELHGAACGVLAGGGGADELLQLLGADALVDSTTLLAFWRANAIFAFDEDMRFAPIFTAEAAEEGAPLAARVDDLAQWSASFLAGFARLSGGNAGLAKLPEESREIVQDLAAVAGAEADVGQSAATQDAVSDDNEADYIQLVEFVRVAVLLLLSAQLPAARQSEGESH